MSSEVRIKSARLNEDVVAGRRCGVLLPFLEFRDLSFSRILKLCKVSAPTLQRPSLIHPAPSDYCGSIIESVFSIQHGLSRLHFACLPLHSRHQPLPGCCLCIPLFIVRCWNHKAKSFEVVSAAILAHLQFTSSAS